MEKTNSLKKKYSEAVAVEYDVMETVGTGYMQYESYNQEEIDRMLGDAIDEAYKLGRQAYLESITEHKLYCIILAVQEEIELGGTSLNLLQSHRKLMAKAIKNEIDGGK